MLTQSLIEKYNVAGPRYTSYPAAVEFVETDKPVIESYLVQRNSKPRDVSIYIHLPFCASLCWYCGCTTVITKKRDKSDEYLNYIEKELAYLAGILHPNHSVKQIHYGGGTPTFLTPGQLEVLGQMLHNYLNIDKNVEFGVEIDPRTFTGEHLQSLKKYGMNRASVGVQDVNPEVQEAIHRIQPLDMVKETFRMLRDSGIQSVNADIIYGLPRQTEALFENTLNAIKDINPERIAAYSYAHVPWMKPAQKLLKEEELPDANLKMALLKKATLFFEEMGYEFIGMDHFAKKDDELSIALKEGSLQRNFQGYSTGAGLDLYGLGMSSISSVGRYYFQNEKELDFWKKQVEEYGNAWVKGLPLTDDDEIRRDVVMQVMCKRRLSFDDIAQKWGINPKLFFDKELNQLDGFIDDGLLELNDDGIQVSETGKYFLRNIAMTFDPYMEARKAKPTFSKTV